VSGMTKFPAENAIIGRLLTGYSDLELDLLHAVHNATGDFDTALKGMFGARGETLSINTAVKLGRPSYVALGLGADFDAAIDAMRHCLSIRNQYAHHTFWDDYSGQLAIGALEMVAKQPGPFADLGSVQVEHVDCPLLQEQERYFRFTDGLLAWVNYEGRRLTGNVNATPPKPAAMPRPRLHL
jgi:hypothetical protein